MSIQFPSTVTTISVVGDSTITNVVLQLHGDGANAATNNTVLDASTNNFTITRTGTPTQGAVNPFGSSWSNYFDGSTGYLSSSPSTPPLGAGNFTIEAWINTNYSNAVTTAGISAQYNTGSGSGEWIFGIRQNAVYMWQGTNNYNATVTISNNQWHHIAWVRNGSGTNNNTVYVDGVSVLQFTNTTNLSGNGLALTVGTWLNASSGPFPGYISNLRILNGTALYTTAFTPPTSPLTTVTNTVLLTAATNRFQDTSTASNTITVTGAVTVQRFAPFPAVSATAYTPATSVTTYSGSVYFNGSTDYLTIPYTASAFNLTSNFSIEFWINPLSYTTSGIIANGAASFTGNAFACILNHGTQVNKISFWAYNVSSSGALLASNVIPLNAWTHIALVCSAGTLSLYQNGISVSTYSLGANTLYISNVQLNVGYYWSGYFTGYLSNLRVVNGTAVYTTAFTPPTAPLSTVTNTQLLLLGANAGIYDSTMQNDVVTVGSAQISTATVKYGSGSMYFNGSGSYLTAPTSTGFAFASNFTVEFWVYPTTFVQYGCMFDTRTVNTNATGFYIRSQGTFSSGQWQVSNGSGSFNISASSNLTASAWQHVALVRSGTTLTLYLNGTSVGSATVSQNFSDGGLRIASAIDGYQFAGYIDDLRITNGVTRYTATFTPPTSANPDTASVNSTTYTTTFTTANNVYATVTTTGIQGQGGTSVYTTSTGLFAGTSVVHTYTNTGISYFTATNTMIVSYLAVGGGGAGGDNFGGGGGAGGFITGTFTATSGNTYVITVGTGGANAGRNAAGNPGSSSTITATGFTSIIAWGGGGGAQCGGGGLPGASGGGAAGNGSGGSGGTATPTVQGNTGGGTTGSGTSHGGGGGGGAGSVGTTSSPSLGGTGGSGSTSTITGSAVIYAGGGGGGGYSPGGAAAGAGGSGGGGSGAGGTNTQGGAGGTNTGGGGGGSSGGGNGPGGGPGGPGIVVLSYAYVSTATILLSTGTAITYTYVNGRWSPRPFNTGTLDISETVFLNQANTATTAFALSAGVSSQRPTTALAGEIRFNTQLNTVETWSTVSGTWTSLTPSSYTIEYLAIGAGGGASSTAGGGAGGALAGFTQVVTGTTYNIAVGQGSSGAGGISYIAPSTAVVVSSTGTASNAGTGGTFYTTATGLFSGTSAVHVFTATGTSYFTTTNALTAAILIVAGGGGGGGAGGGGGGGMVTGTVTLLANTTFTISVGSGGSSVANGTPAANGSPSSISGPGFSTITALGGGGSGTSAPSPGIGNPGGSGGGAGGNGAVTSPSSGGTATQPSANPGIPGIFQYGNPGGTTPGGAGSPTGGGGGAGGAGGTSNGGPGYPSGITGTARCYAGGGGGSTYNSGSPGPANAGGGGGGARFGPPSTPGTAGTPGTGGGGGGCNAGNGAGGPGIVVLSYAYTASTVITTVNSASALVLAYGGFAGTATGGASGSGYVGQGFTATSTAGAGATSSTGSGIYSLVTGAPTQFAQGGTATGSSPGGTNTGNGGSAPGGTGAPGVVYIRYQGGQRASGGSVSTVGTYTLHTFVSTGTFTA